VGIPASQTSEFDNSGRTNLGKIKTTQTAEGEETLTDSPQARGRRNILPDPWKSKIPGSDLIASAQQSGEGTPEKQSVRRETFLPADLTSPVSPSVSGGVYQSIHSALPPVSVSGIVPPSDPPEETIVAPSIPSSILFPPANLGSNLAPNTPPNNILSLSPPPVSAINPSLVPSSTLQPLASLPAAAPISALTSLPVDAATTEAVKAATVDLGGGSDGVPTLLTWKTNEEAQIESGPPKNVYVTGTFANSWKTKIQLRKKSCVLYHLEFGRGEERTLTLASVVRLPSIQPLSIFPPVNIGSNSWSIRNGRRAGIYRAPPMSTEI
jgi:hypothetical protein